MFAADYGCLRDLVRSRPFCGVMLSIQKVPACHSIQVFNVGDLSIDHLMLYFENAKSGGDEILEREMHAKENFAILKFANRKGWFVLCFLANYVCLSCFSFLDVIFLCTVKLYYKMWVI